MTVARTSAAKAQPAAKAASKNTPATLNVVPPTPLMSKQGACACGGECPRCKAGALQAKRAATTPGDGYEREADRMAEHVLRMPDPARASETPRTAHGAAAKAKASSASTESRPTLSRAVGTAYNAGTARAEVTPPIVEEALRTPGHSLATPVRAFMEPRFGHDFSDVRVHADTGAAASARAVNALAYTVGRDVVFAAGQYTPSTDSGRKLLAHELAHVVQQRTSPLAIQRKAAIGELPAPGEVDFDTLADQVYDAMDRWGTDEEAVYRALQQLRGDPAMIKTLIARYAQRHDGADLIADIESDFSDTELEYALQLLGRGHAGAAQEVVIGPEATNLERAARRLHAAMEDWGTDEEAIYATLLPFNRATQDLEKTYLALFGNSLREEIIGEMSSSELDYALSLLSFDADSFIEQNFEESQRPLARKILNDILAVKTDRLDFADERELAVDISKRLRTSQLMQESQTGGAFAYPESCTQDDCPGACIGHGQPGDPNFVPANINFNAHVNKDARVYWVRSADAQNYYQFTLTPDGWEDPYRALVRLFTPQPSICDQTLIHCDYLTTVIHLRAFAESIGTDVFNKRVQSGAIAMNLSYWGFRDLMLPAAPGSPEAGYARSREAVSLQAVRPSSEDELLIGDHVIFWNHLAYDALTASPTWAGPWRLENALLVDQDENGENLYEGHGAPTNEAQEVVKGNAALVLKDMVVAYNGPAQAAINLTKSVERGDAGAQADLNAKFPRIVPGDAPGTWWIAELDTREENRVRPQRFYGLRLLIDADDPALVGLRDPTDVSKMGWVKRPIESAPGRSPSRPK
jgi:hypothetical protein